MTDTLDEMRSLLEQARDLIDEAITTHIYDLDNGDKIPKDCPYTALVRAITKLLKKPQGIIDITLIDQSESKKKLPAKVDLRGGQISVWLAGHGDAGSMNAASRPILVELYDGEARTIVWSDIRQEDPTHIISMDGAKEERRE